MYSVSPVYGDKPFDEKYLPTCMYPMRPYYEMDCTGNGTEELPELLPSFAGIDLNDNNTKNALEDILSRQMLLICRLNELEQKLTQTESQPQQLQQSTLPSLTSKQQHEDITVHFDLDHVPYSLFTLINCLAKSSVKIMTNFHLHSSVVNEHGIRDKVANFHRQLTEKINFRFTDRTEFGSRSEFSLIVTFIVKKQSDVFGVFNSKQGPINGEIILARKLVELVSKPTESDNRLWEFIQNGQLLRSDKSCLEQLGPMFSNVSSSASTLSLAEAVLWSLTSFDGCTVPVARSLRSIFSGAWQSSMQKFATR